MPGFLRAGKAGQNAIFNKGKTNRLYFLQSLADLFRIHFFLLPFASSISIRCIHIERICLFFFSYPEIVADIQTKPA